MSPTDAIAVVKQLPAQISATPDNHAKIQLAIATLESLALAAEAKSATPSPLPPRPARRRR